MKKKNQEREISLSSQDIKEVELIEPKLSDAPMLEEFTLQEPQIDHKVIEDITGDLLRNLPTMR